MTESTTPSIGPLDGEDFDLVLVGGGLVGLATARAFIQKQPQWRVAVLDKEARFGVHQSGHNSGVLHSGIYYKPGSLKAQLAVQGSALMRQYCLDHKLPVRASGKIILATKDEQLGRLKDLFERGQANGVEGLKELSASEIQDYEPAARGVAAIWVPSAASVDYKAVTETLIDELRAAGVTFISECLFRSAHIEGNKRRLLTSRGEFLSTRVVVCGGLFSDRLARQTGLEPGLKIVPFRGEYRQIRAARQELVKGLIYPVPDPRLPFLGVHLTRVYDSRLEAGPNAVVAFRREGYRRGQCSLRDMLDTALFPGSWRLLWKYWRTAVAEEARSLSTRLFLKSLQELVPALEAQDIEPAGAGVRAQALEASGELVDDFRFVSQPGLLHVLNAPSPAATACLSIGEYVRQSFIEP